MTRQQNLLGKRKQDRDAVDSLAITIASAIRDLQWHITAGEVVSDVECERRMQVAKQTGEPHFYMMELSPGLIIDARDKGNVARLINSSCAPNCQSQKWHDAATGVQPPACCLPKPGHIVGATLWWSSFMIFIAVHADVLCATVLPIAVMSKLGPMPNNLAKH